MYCDRCGAALNLGAQFCTTCGERILAGPQPQAVPVYSTPTPNMPVTGSGRVQRHISLLAALWMVNGFLRLLEVASLTFVGHVIFPGLFWRHWGEWGFPFRDMWPFSVGLAWIAVMLGAFGIVHLVLAWGLYEKKAWARPLGIVIGFLALLRIPLGTALGIYTLWVLLPDLSRREYEQIAVS